MPGIDYVKKLSFLHIFSIPGSITLLKVIAFALLTAATAQISFPVKPVPFTLQTMAVVLSGAFLGARAGAYSQIIYLIMGIAGLPVFAQTADLTFGAARLFGPTGGYLLSFPLAAFISGLLISRYKSYLSVVSIMFLGNLIIITCGVLYLYSFFINDIYQAAASGAVIFSLWTVIKVFAGAAVYFGLRKSKI